MLDLDVILDHRFAAGTKGLPDAALGLPLREFGAQGWRLLDGGIPLPAAVIRSSALTANIAAMRGYLARVGAWIAPHGKTTMCPQLFERQLEAGAWGMTVATYAQARAAMSFGVKRLLIANVLVGDAEIRGLSAQLDAAPDLQLLSLVDSVAAVGRLEATLAARGARKPFDVLVEVGFPGGRCGARTTEVAIEVARCAARSPHLRLRGVEGYEGLIAAGASASQTSAVDQYLARIVEVVDRWFTESLFADPAGVLVSAGGSAYFDLVAAGLRGAGHDRTQLILRSGCYLTHDSGFYEGMLRQVAERAVAGPAPDLQPALEVWAQIISRPEPGLLILGAGRRDLSDDNGMPRVRYRTQPGLASAPEKVEGWTLFKLNDQHAYVRLPPDAQAEVGDYIGIGISHPCTTFDRWPFLYEVDDDYRVIGAFKTCF